MRFRTIYVTAEDSARVERLMLFCDLFTKAEQKRIRRLYYDVSQGRVVRADKIPADVVTTYSRVELREKNGNSEVALVLVFPDDMDGGFGRVSIVTPIGAELFGRRVGDMVECRNAKGIRRFVIQSTTYLKGRLG